MSDLISRNKVLEELNKYEKELRKDKTEAIETYDEQMMFAITNQETAICRIRRNILHMPTAYGIDKVVDELEKESYRIDDSATLSSRDVINIEEAIEIVKQSDVADDVCEWIMDEEGLCKTSCNHLNSSPITCKYMYCPYCSKKIKVVE